MSQHPEEAAQLTSPKQVGPEAPAPLCEQEAGELAHQEAAKKSDEKAINANKHQWWPSQSFWQVVTQLLALTAVIVSAWNLRVTQQQLAASQEQFRLSERPLILGRVQETRRAITNVRMVIPIRLGNYGKSAALAVRGVSAAFTGPNAPVDVERWFRVDAASAASSPIQWVIPPGVGISAPDAFTVQVPIPMTLPINLDELPVGHGGHGLNALFVVMRVTYRDSLNHLYRTDICAYFTREAIEYCGQHNNAGDPIDPADASRGGHTPYP